MTVLKERLLCFEVERKKRKEEKMREEEGGSIPLHWISTCLLLSLEISVKKMYYL